MLFSIVFEKQVGEPRQPPDSTRLCAGMRGGGNAGADRKPGSVEGNHSSGTAVTSCLKQPTRETARDRRRRASLHTPLFGLAPGGVYRAANCYQSRGALLPHLFTLTAQRGGGIFSVALSMGSHPPGVTWRPVRRSPDFPLRRKPQRLSGRLRLSQPAESSSSHYFLSAVNDRINRFFSHPIIVRRYRLRHSGEDERLARTACGQRRCLTRSRHPIPR